MVTRLSTAALLTAALAVAACSGKHEDAGPAGSRGTTSRGSSTPATRPSDTPATQGGAGDERSNAVVNDILQKIRSDPRITRKDIHVSFVPRSATAPDDTIALSGTVASDDEREAAVNDAISVSNIGISSSLNVATTRPAAEPGPWSETSAGPSPIVPVCPGLTIVTAVASQGDYESIKTIESVTDEAIRLKYSAEWTDAWWSYPHPELHRMTTHRTVLTKDLGASHRYNQIFTTTEHTPETAADTTALGTSSEVLRELKTKGESAFAVCNDASDVEVKGLEREFRPPSGSCTSFAEMTLERIGSQPEPVRTLLNGSAVELPAVHARAKATVYEPSRYEFFFLNDERNPLTLMFRLGIGEVPALSPDTRHACETKGRQGLFTLIGGSCDLPDGGDRDTLRVVKIDSRCASDLPSATGANALEQALSTSGKADVYSIYFSFNSDVIREESEATLKDIAEVMKRHPNWRLSVNGHTDAVGGDQSNLELSKRRSAAVKDALVKRYAVAGTRLMTSGFGKSQPKDSNDTLEGRARNRRVELVRLP